MGTAVKGVSMGSGSEEYEEQPIKVQEMHASTSAACVRRVGRWRAWPRARAMDDAGAMGARFGRVWFMGGSLSSGAGRPDLAV